MTMVSKPCIILSMLVDTHVHLPQDLGIAHQLVDRANEAKVTKLITIGTNLKDSKAAIKTALHLEGVYASCGIYPHEERELSLDELCSNLKTLISHQPKVVGIGECGFDITNWAGQRPVAEQKELFEAQILLAKEFMLPIIIHNRNGDELVLELLRKHKTSALTGVAHCFTQDTAFAEQLIKLGFYISFSGFITHQSKQHLVEVANHIDLAHIVVETDSPYIVPKGVKEKHNEPKNVKIVVEKLASIKKISFEACALQTTKNAQKLFNLS